MLMKIKIFHEEFPNFFSLMSTRVIDIEVDDLLFEPKRAPRDFIQEINGIPLLGFYQPVESIDKIHTTEQIQSFLMLSSG